MDAGEVYRLIQELSANRNGTPVFIEELTSALQVTRPYLFSFLVDLSMAGNIDISQSSVTLTVLNQGV